MSDNNQYILRWHTTIVKRNQHGGWQVVAAQINGGEIQRLDKHYDTKEEALEMANLYQQSERCEMVLVES
jgi:hypothetical protein